MQIRDHSGYWLSQWGTLQWNVISHWLSPYPEWPSKHRLSANGSKAPLPLVKRLPSQPEIILVRTLLHTNGITCYNIPHKTCTLFRLGWFCCGSYSLTNSSHLSANTLQGYFTGNRAARLPQYQCKEPLICWGRVTNLYLSKPGHH